MDDLLSHPPRVVGVNRFPFAPGETVARRANSSLLVCFVSAGNGVLTIDSQQWPLAAGHLALVPWGRWWSLADAGALAVLTVHLRFLPWDVPDQPLRHWFPGEPPTAADPAPDLGCGPRAPVPAQALATAEALLAAWASRDPARAFRLRALAATLVETLLPPARPGGGAQGAAAVLAWLAWSQRLDVTRAELERRSGLGRTAFGAAFKALTGASPAAWLLDRRLAEARRLLATTAEPVAAVAARTGFGDPFHFSRCFRSRYGLSPRQARSLGWTPAGPGDAAAPAR
ncbi:MAG: AraC family transcriptional regulator [Planctomycetes bacterium]|nr:AraC family transcriptional regulator [Planctomycetota bacterium]